MKDGHEVHYLPDPDITPELLGEYGFEKEIYRPSGHLPVAIYAKDDYGFYDQNEGWEIVKRIDNKWVGTNMFATQRSHLLKAISLMV